jgi:AraC-like DNA-binding protein
MYWTHFTVHVFGVYDALDQVPLPWMAPLAARHRDSFERLMSLFPAANLESLFSSQSIVLDMLSTFARGRAAERLSGLIRRAERFSGVLNFMNERLSQPIRLGDLAHAAYLEPTYFSAEFKRTFGLSPMRYLNRLRIEEAQRRLLTSEASIAEVAAAVGFCDAFHFSKRFKDCAGCSPSQYRERQVTAFRHLGWYS